MRWRQVVVGGVGVLVTSLAVLSVFAPDVLLAYGPIAGVTEWLRSLSLRTVLLAASLTLGGYVVWSARRGQREEVIAADDVAATRFESALDQPPEAVTADEQSLTAAELDERFTQAVEGEEDAVDAVRSQLSAVVAGVLVGRDGLAEATARERVLTGEWTDDPVASAFLGDDRAPTPPVLSRIRLWLDPEAERQRRIRRTVESLDAETGRGDEA